MLKSCLPALMLVLAAPATAQTAEQWTDTPVIVSAQLSGPALWRLKKGNSEVIVIGVPPVFPKNLGWKTKRVENALKGAKALITPPAGKAGVGDMLSLMRMKGLPNGQDLKSVLPADLYNRYETTAARAGVSTRAFQHDKPVWAAARLRQDVLGHLALTGDEPVQTIARLARRQDVPVRVAARYRLSPVLKDVNAMDAAAERTCMTRTLDDIDFDIDRAPRTAAAWVAGDMKTVLANYHGSALMDCLDGSGKGSALMEQATDDAVDAITDALATPGKTVAVLPLAPLLRRGGALDRVRAQGIAVTAPNY
ncbi:TraB/GumN family protein [Asticcacaulis solisilvae]|uniref:TraB/GumN family protein n=1 Tax=Asticcacaulis solisilvae TaxID=1217274 RepID=UPI003FD7D055